MRSILASNIIKGGDEMKAVLLSEQNINVNWKKINEAIMKRWSEPGLDRIKNLAWSGKCFNQQI